MAEHCQSRETPCRACRDVMHCSALSAMAAAVHGARQLRPDHAKRSVHPAAAALSAGGERAAHRCADHADPPRPASRGLRRQSECGGEGPSAGRGDGAVWHACQAWRTARDDPHRCAQQRRRSCQPFDVLAVDGGQGRRAQRRSCGGDRSRLRLARQAEGGVQSRRPDAVRLRLGDGERRSRQASLRCSTGPTRTRR